MRVGGYYLHLYCDRTSKFCGDIVDDRGHRHDEFPHMFYGQTSAGCDRQARARGWLISADRQLCPKCSGKART